MCGPVLAVTDGQAASRGGEAEPIAEPGPSPLVLTQTVPSGLAPESGVSDEAASAGTKSGTVTRKARPQRERGGD